MTTPREHHRNPRLPMDRAVNAGAQQLKVPRDLRTIGIEPVRCHARNRRGERCGRWATPACTVCRLHGSRAPWARRAAEARIATALANKYAARYLARTPQPAVDAAVARHLALLEATGG